MIPEIIILIGKWIRKLIRELIRENVRLDRRRNNMRYKAILFDMDGTLLPMDMDQFIGAYFSELTKVMLPFGFTKEELKKKLFVGVDAMVRNDGHQTNMEAFWEVLAKGHEDMDMQAVVDTTNDFYTKDFHKVKAVATKENPLAVKAVALAREKAEQVILSTNPLFPAVAQASRLSWIGLKPEDFELVTAYEDNLYCKPNPQYFVAICERMGLDPKECFMIGNDELEDMHTASSLGMDCYLVTDWMIPREGYTWTGKKGTFEDLLNYLASL